MARAVKLDYKSIMRDGRGNRMEEFLELFIGATEVEIVEEEDGCLGFHYNYDNDFKDRIPYAEYGLNLIMLGRDVKYALDETTNLLKSNGF